MLANNIEQRNITTVIDDGQSVPNVIRFQPKSGDNVLRHVANIQIKDIASILSNSLSNLLYATRDNIPKKMVNIELKWKPLSIVIR